MAYRKLKYNDEEYYFNSTIFIDLFSIKKDIEKKKYEELEEELANILNVTRNAVHNWRFNQNGPSDIEIVKKIANFFGLSNVESLLIIKKEVDNKMLNDLQIQSIKKVYDSIINFLEIFAKTNGFNDLWFELDMKPEYRKDELYEIAEKEHNKVKKKKKKEYFYLRKTQIYFDLENYIYNNLYEIYEGKLSYGYRFEAEGEKYGSPTLLEDYNKALNAINDIIDKYIKLQ